ncbi:VanZ family protein [Clostridium sp. MD294]|uniref:VanZ family protein n=1 Tax=Clostridium sp. MD294 TaxID=97138 RepID=UPI0002CC5CB8|nr:VanZ family protein [Clostridium sp. MD294]NDO46310.1 hypothetical protein [Clostridium sp. MD294]USF29263.1 hypothetical protein C820_000648 [Clostridium sp. MD294]
MNKFKTMTFIVYIVFLAMFYFLIRLFIIDAGSFVKNIYSFHNTYSIEMFNFVPLKNIIYYSLNTGRKVGNYEYLFQNVIFYIILWLPMGYFFADSKANFKKSLLFIFLVVTVISFIRVVLLIGFFDIDKILLSCIGFSLGYYITKKLHKIIYIKDVE